MNDDATEPAPKQIPVWVQVADAGFGATVEAHGFRRVGKAMWQLDGDGITHRIKLHAGPSKRPGTFRDHISISFDGYDELYARVGMKPWDSTFIPGTKIRCHSHWRLWDKYLGSEATRYQATLDRHNKLLGSNSPSPRPDHFHNFVRPVLHLEGEFFGSRSSLWTTSSTKIVETSQQIISLWIVHGAPISERIRSFKDYYDKYYAQIN